jgi:lysozyme
MPKIITTKNVVIALAIVALIFMSTTTSTAEILIARFEGKRLKPYQDTGGIWTVGYGSTYNIDAKRPVNQSDIIDDATAIRWLKSQVGTFQNQVKAVVKVPVNQNKVDSLTSLAYNIGINAFKSSTLLKLLNEGRPEIEVADQFLRWNKVNGIISNGLTIRRKAERDLFLR